MDINKRKDFYGREYYSVIININDFKEFIKPKSSLEELAFNFLSSYDHIEYLHFTKKYNKNNLSLCCDYNELEVSFDRVFSGLMEIYDYDMISFLDEIDSKMSCSEDLSFIGFKKSCLAVISEMEDLQDKAMIIIKDALDKYIELEEE